MPPRINIDDFRDEILGRRMSREPLSETLVFLNELIVAAGVSAISINTLKRTLSTWGVTRITAGDNLEAYYEDICDLYDRGVGIDIILNTVNSLFQENNLSIVSRRTLLNQLNIWGLNTRHEAVPVTEELVERVKYYFFNFGFSDDSILRDLQKDGFQANLYIIRQIRWKNGMKRRVRTYEEQQERLGQAIQFLHKDLQRSSAVLGFGKGLLYQYVRQQAQVVVSQRRLYNYYRAAFPKEVAGRRDGNFK